MGRGGTPGTTQDAKRAESNSIFKFGAVLSAYRLNRRWFLIIGHEECRWQRELVQFINYIHFAKAQGHHTDLLEVGRDCPAREHVRDSADTLTWMNRMDVL